jgi:hypothetical protein
LIPDQIRIFLARVNTPRARRVRAPHENEDLQRQGTSHKSEADTLSVQLPKKEGS